MRAVHRRSRSGTVLPMMGVCLIGLIAFVALAVDLGMLAVARTQAQNAADVAALVGTRTLNNKPGAVNNDLIAAVALAKTVGTSNPHLSGNFTNAEMAKIEVGQYLYDPSTQTFSVTAWTDVTHGQTATPPSGSWTAMQITITTSEPTYFMKALGVSSMPGGARAVAVYRPRDVAFVLDMTGSMGYSCTFNAGNVQDNSMDNQSLNPDTMYPTFGHYDSTNGKLVATANQANSGGEAYPRNNYTIATPGGPPMIRGFYFDPTNAATPTTSAYPVTNVSANLKNAFHRWSPPESGGDSTTYTPPTYDFTGYNAYHNGTESTPMGPTPAPYSYATMTDDSTLSLTYTGDRWRRANGGINKTQTSWSGSTNRAALHAADLLGYSSLPSGFSSGWINFRDPVWETYGYDLDIPKYRTARASGGPFDPAVYLANNGGVVNNILVPAADRYQGFSMGPGYWGKTFFMWPPDPRTPVGNPGDSGYQAGDWRLRYFRNRNNGTFNPQSDNNSNTSGSGNIEGVNEVLLRNGSGYTVSAYGSSSNPNWRIDYTDVLRWIKSGPQVLPANLRAGRVLFYTSIPDDVDTSTGSTQQKLDKRFWKEYIDYVLGWRYTNSSNLYGTGDSWSAASASILTNDMTKYTFSWEASGSKPYMRYTDSPSRPRLHFWFGPLSMVDFIGNGYQSGYGGSNNWNPGTTYEAHCWQLKAGMSSVLDDVRNNHPNDFVAMTMFSAPDYNGVRVPIGQDFKALKNALFYPKSLLPAINAGDTTTEIRPYDINYNPVDADEIPNANGSTDPNTGLAYAFNMLSPSANLSTSTYGTIKGRRGASKLVIFETDGVPNTYRSTTLNKAGYNTYYTLGGSSGNVGNGDATAMSRATGVIQQITKPMSSVTTGGVDSGLSLPNAPARVYPIAFGDLFDTTLAPSATFRPTALQFMADCAYYGGTGPSGASTLPTNQIITGPYSQRITRLRDCLEQIFQSGVSVTLIE